MQIGRLSAKVAVEVFAEQHCLPVATLLAVATGDHPKRNP